MKKNFALLLALLLALTMLAGCGASASGATMDYAANGSIAQETAAAAADVPETPIPDYEEVAAEAPSEAQASAGGLVSGELTGDFSEKIIYSAYAELETTEFEESLEKVYKLLDRYGAFLESSSVNGSNISDTIYGTQSNRSANFVLRVPKDNFSAMTSALDQVGNVTYLTNNAENITSQYTDTASRLKAYETEEERLLEIMAKAETVEDMIDLENRLSEIRYQKENLTSQLKNWDARVDYSSVTINLIEVKVLTPEPQEDPTYGQELKEAFIGSVKFMGRACKALLKLFVEVIPVLLPLGIVILVVVLICLRAQKKKEAKKAAKEAERKDIEEP